MLLRVLAWGVLCVRDLNTLCDHICIFVCVCLLVNRISATLDLRSIENRLVSTLEVKATGFLLRGPGLKFRLFGLCGFISFSLVLQRARSEPSIT